MKKYFVACISYCSWARRDLVCCYFSALDLHSGRVIWYRYTFIYTTICSVYYEREKTYRIICKCWFKHKFFFSVVDGMYVAHTPETGSRFESPLWLSKLEGRGETKAKNRQQKNLSHAYFWGKCRICWRKWIWSCNWIPWEECIWRAFDDDDAAASAHEFFPLLISSRTKKNV